MKLTIMSDLHLEMTPYSISNPQKADVLCLCGDIVNSAQLSKHHGVRPWSDALIFQRGLYEHDHNHFLVSHQREFIKQCSNEFEHTVVVAGNHEYYRSYWDKTLHILKEEYSKYPNIHFLENESISLNNITFIGSTLWTSLNNRDPVSMITITKLLNDYRLIKNLSHSNYKLRAEDTAVRHDRSVDYLIDALKNLTGTTVVLTHHMPSTQCIDEQYRSDYYMNSGYASDLDHLILDNSHVAVWGYGHTHTPTQFTIGNTVLVNNARGYSSELTDWEPNLVIEV